MDFIDCDTGISSQSIADKIALWKRTCCEGRGIRWSWQRPVLPRVLQLSSELSIHWPSTSSLIALPKLDSCQLFTRDLHVYLHQYDGDH